MWTRVSLLILLLCPAPALAQPIPDFSGVFLRNPLGSHDPFTELTGFEAPLVLNIKQGADTLQVTVMQNGAQATRVYDLSGKPSINASTEGVRMKSRIRFKGDKLVIKSEEAGRWSPVIGLPAEETWMLSPDRQTLTIRVRDSRQLETYARQTSLPEALEKAREASGMNKCNGFPPTLAKLSTPKLNQGVFLGLTGFQQLGWEVLFQAGLGGEFFDDLTRTDAPGALEFRRKGKHVPAYSGSLILEVAPRVTRAMSDTRWDPWPWQPLVGNERLPEWLLALRFRIKWVDSESRELGEVPSELRQEPWPELSTPEKWYRLEIPAQDVPLTDNLEIHILSAAGNQLGCISGHI